MPVYRFDDAWRRFLMAISGRKRAARSEKALVIEKPTVYDTDESIALHRFEPKRTERNRIESNLVRAFPWQRSRSDRN